MRRFLLDTGIAGDFINRRNGVYLRAKQEATLGHRMGSCTPVLGELYYGAEYSVVGNCTVVSAASDLAATPGLMVENWRS